MIGAMSKNYWCESRLTMECGWLAVKRHITRVWLGLKSRYALCWYNHTCLFIESCGGRRADRSCWLVTVLLIVPVLVLCLSLFELHNFYSFIYLVAFKKVVHLVCYMALILQPAISMYSVSAPIAGWTLSKPVISLLAKRFLSIKEMAMVL